MEFIEKIEKFIGNVKFAVIIIALFTASLVYGTFMESYHGAEYANRLIYKSPVFMVFQLGMFLSIFISTLLRFPMKKRLYGFYILHLGLLMIFAGSFVTFEAGIDGNMPLSPNSPARTIDLNDDLLIITKNNTSEVSYKLPFIAQAQNLDIKLTDDYQVLDYLPFADEEVQWQKNLNPQAFQNSGQYLLANKMFSEKLTFSLHQLSDFKSSARLGPLSVNYLPMGFSNCFGSDQSDYILWDSMTQTCLKGIVWTKKKTPNGTEILMAQSSTLKEVFVPKIGPFPVYINEDKLLPKSISPLRLFDRSGFKEKPHLFLFGTSTSFYDADSQKWVVKQLNKSEKIDLPWMGFQLKMAEFHTDKYPVLIPIGVKPIQDSGELISGKTRAVRVKINSGEYSKVFWVKQNQPLKVTLAGEVYRVSLSKESVTLPFQITLDQFKMDTDPGTRSPASYESFVSLFQNGNSKKHHIFMNNPLNHLGLTFYQASYFQTRSGAYGSVLSINYDPGRFLKYLGSLLLVFGSFWHFVIRRKTIKI